MTEFDPKTADLAELEKIIRDYVNRPRLHGILSADARKFHILCSALDALDDAETGIDAYLALKDPHDPGTRYLLLYGLLQMLFVEQDAVTAICRVFDIPASHWSEIADIREIRNYSVGHPVPNRDGEPAGLISRFELGLREFRVTLYWPDRPAEYKEIDVYDLIDRQRRALCMDLRATAMKLGESEIAHRMEFREKKLADILHPSLPYLLSKIGTETRSEAIPAGRAALNTVSRMIADLQAALAERGRPDAGSNLFSDLSYPMDKLSAYYDNPDSQTLDSECIYILGCFLENRILELSELAREIDNEYKSDELPI